MAATGDERPDASTAERPSGVASTQRMLAVIIPVDKQAWFLKAMGPVEKISAIESDFNAIVDGLNFEAGQPKFSLPEGWSKVPGSQFRYATLRTRAGEVGVTKLPLNAALDPYVLANVNRWRGQLSLPDTDAAGLADSAKPTKIAGFDGFYVDLTGQGSDGGMSRPPFAGGGPQGPAAGLAPPPSTAEASNDNAADSDWSYDAPEAWATGRTNQFRVAAFDIKTDAGEAEVTVIPLGKSAGTVLENVNRWRGQIGLDEITEDDLDGVVKKIQAGPIEGAYVELMSTDTDGQAILAAMLPTSDQTIFVKLTGARAVAEEQAAAFRKFAESIRTPKQ